MSHFLESRPENVLGRPEGKYLTTAWPAVKVLWRNEDGGVLVVMPTPIPIQKPGVLRFVPLPEDVPVLIPEKDPGHYKNVRGNGAGMFRGKKMDFWISINTEDPDHALICWDGVSGIDDGQSRVVLAVN